MWYVYIIESRKKNFIYIGSTNDLKRRFIKHNNGMSQSTKAYRPYELLACIPVQLEVQARSLEQYFKTGSGKAILYQRILGKDSGRSFGEE